MVIYELCGFGQTYEWTRDQCYRYGALREWDLTVFGRYDRILWLMKPDEARGGCRMTFRRQGVSWVWLITGVRPWQRCDGQAVSLWRLWNQGTGLTWYAWSSYVGYASHVAPRVYCVATIADPKRPLGAWKDLAGIKEF